MNADPVAARRRAVSARRLRLGAAVPLRRVWLSIARVAQFVANELRADRPARTVTALRIASIVATFALLMAVFHVQSGTAQYALWLLVAPVGPMLKPAQALKLALAAAAFSALSIPLSGAMAGAPGLMLVFIGVFTAASVYAVNALRLGARGFVMQLIFLEAFYNMIVVPGRVGVLATNTFAGYMIAFFTVALFDCLLWPHPAEPLLARSLASSLRVEGRRMLSAIGRGEGELRPFSATESDLAAHMSLFQRAVAEKAARGEEALLDAVTRVEQVFVQIEHLAGIVNDLHFESIPEPLLSLIDETVVAADDEIDVLAGSMEASFTEPGAPLPAAGDRIRAPLGRLRTAIARLVPKANPSPGFAKLGGLVRAFQELEDILSLPFDAESGAAGGAAARPFSGPLDPSLARFSVKTALAVVVCFCIGFIVRDPRLWVAPVTVFTVAFPAYGTAVRRMFLRLGGSVIGGLIIIPVMMVAISSGGGLPEYLALTLTVVFIAGYAGQSSEKIAYAGRQIGDVFILVFMAVGPLVNIYDPVWRIWGVFMGILIPGIFYWLLWPQHAGMAVPRRLAGLLRRVRSVLPGGAAGRSRTGVDQALREVVRGQAELMTLASDAVIEGPLSGVNPGAVVDSCAVLVKMFHRSAALSLAERRAYHRPGGEPAVEFTKEGLFRDEISGLRRVLRDWQKLFESGDPTASPKAWDLAHAVRRAAPQLYAEETLLDKLERRLAESESALHAKGAREAELRLHGETEAVRHLHRLLLDLNTHLAMVPSVQAS